MSTGAGVTLKRVLSVFEKFIYIMYFYISCALEVTIFDRVFIISETKTQKLISPPQILFWGPVEWFFA